MDSSSWAAYSKIDPELEALIPHLPPHKSFADYPDVLAVRATIDQMVAEGIKAGVFQLPDLTGIAVEKIQIPVRDGATIGALVYRSETAKPGPLIVYNHGGGFTFGSADNWVNSSKMAVNELGAVVVSIDYRLAPEISFPVSVNDGWDALKWAAENAESLGADPTKGFIVAGTSAGGNVAAVAAHEAVDANLSPPLTGVYLSVPLLTHQDAIPEEYRQHHNSEEQNKDARILDKRGMDWFWGIHLDPNYCKTVIDNPSEQYKPDTKSHLASPLWWPGGHKKQPATYIQICGYVVFPCTDEDTDDSSSQDPLRDDSLIYEHFLKEAGVPVKTDVYAGIPHASTAFMPMLSKSKKAAEDLKVGLQWILDQKA
ncbi:Alpha/Beta hydrolase protein [Dendryphion nanum]|uniref:Alpha/Beta hydrolase protein n=1 Tax=Dendryphion nanum TaxID=256645 RepID=A0A9P9E6V1_9PLEO|nr:Alpha/Beta hydrolase protein [Dendryphion nanum]